MYDDCMTAHTLQALADRLLAGDLSAADFAVAVQRTGIADVGVAQVDVDRRRRCGFPEVIYAEGKTVEAITRIIVAQLEQEIDVLATRVSAEQAAKLLSQFPTADYNPVGRTFRIAQPPANGEAAGRVTIVTAGTSDLPVGEEARETALWTGAEVRFVQDVGVAGPHRLAANLQVMTDADAIVVVAGMEGRFPAWWAGTFPAR